LALDLELSTTATTDDEVDGENGRSSGFVGCSGKVERGGGDPQAVEERRVAEAHDEMECERAMRRVKGKLL